MENASKALIIAAGVLIAIMILTLFTYLFGKMAGGTEDIYTQMEQTEIAEFNQQFLNYVGRGETVIGTTPDGTPICNPLTIQDVVTIINLAKDNNIRQQRATTVSVIVNGSDWANSSESEEQLLKAYQNERYKCSASGGIIYTNQLVSEIKIYSIP